MAKPWIKFGWKIKLKRKWQNISTCMIFGIIKKAQFKIKGKIIALWNEGKNRPK